MKRTSLSLAALAGATFAAPAPAPTPVAAPAPVAVEAPAPVVAPAPVAVAETPAPSKGSEAPWAPVTDAIVQGNPAAQGSISSVVSIPHRWADKRVAVFQWSGANSVLAYGALDKYFAAFQTNSGRGDLTGGYTTPNWAAGLTINFGKQWRTTSDSLDGVYQANNESSQTYVADGFVLLGSYKLDDIHLSGNLSWRTGPYNDSTFTTATVVNGAPQRNTHSSRYNRVGMALGARTYVTGSEGFAWKAGLTLGDTYLRPTSLGLAAADSAFDGADVYDMGLTGSCGYRFAAPSNAQFYIGTNGTLSMINGKPTQVNNALVNNADYIDYFWSLTLRPNASLLLRLTDRWSFIGGAGLNVTMGSEDDYSGDDEEKFSGLTTAAPTGNIGLRYAKDIWAVEAQIGNEYLANGPYFMSGNQTAGVLSQFALTVNFK